MRLVFKTKKTYLTPVMTLENMIRTFFLQAHIIGMDSNIATNYTTWHVLLPTWEPMFYPMLAVQ